MIYKTPIDLLSVLLTDLEALSDVSLHRDLATIKRRYEREGLLFLTRTLPTFGDQFFRSLNEGTIQGFPGFRRKVALPVFLHGLTSRVFDAKTGDLLKDPCYVSAYCVRQICYLLYKYEVAYTPKQEARAYQKLMDCEKSLDESVKISPTDKVLTVASSIISDIFEDVSWTEFTPRHGPGATNHGRIDPWQKYRFPGPAVSDQYNEEFYVAFPNLLTATCFNNPALDSAYGLLSFDRRTDLRMSKVSAVPKTAKGPRVVSGEAERLMWLQLGIADAMKSAIQRHPLSRGKMPFNDQSVNAALAITGSKTGAWATLDMSEASDRVSMKLCGQLLPTMLMRALCEMRSTHTRIPFLDAEKPEESTIIPLTKMAPMGNGFCFPLETIVFWTLAVATIAVGMREAYVTEKMIKTAANMVYAYGDDLIVPSDWAPAVMLSLERYGFRFNRDKSYWTGPFRESCGTDAFNGVNITPLKLKKLFPFHQEKTGLCGEWVVSSTQICKDWAGLLPSFTAALAETIYDHLQHIPTYPEGWEGCIGVPVSYENMKGRQFRMGEIVKRGKVCPKQMSMEGPRGWRMMKTTHVYAPSDGKLIRVLKQDADLVTPSETDFPPEARCLRALTKPGAFFREKTRLHPEDTGDTGTFNSNNGSGLSYSSAWLS